MPRRLPLDRSGLDSGYCRKVALKECSNAAENDEVLSFDPHPKACVGRSKDRASIFEREELVGTGDLNRQAIATAFRA